MDYVIQKQFELTLLLQHRQSPSKYNHHHHQHHHFRQQSHPYDRRLHSELFRRRSAATISEFFDGSDDGTPKEATLLHEISELREKSDSNLRKRLLGFGPDEEEDGSRRESASFIEEVLKDFDEEKPQIVEDGDDNENAESMETLTAIPAAVPTPRDDDDDYSDECEGDIDLPVMQLGEREDAALVRKCDRNLDGQRLNVHSNVSFSGCREKKFVDSDRSDLLKINISDLHLHSPDDQKWQSSCWRSLKDDRQRNGKTSILNKIPELELTNEESKLLTVAFRSNCVLPMDQQGHYLVNCEDDAQNLLEGNRVNLQEANLYNAYFPYLSSAYISDGDKAKKATQETVESKQINYFPFAVEETVSSRLSEVSFEDSNAQSHAFDINQQEQFIKYDMQSPPLKPLPFPISETSLQPAVFHENPVLDRFCFQKPNTSSTALSFAKNSFANEVSAHKFPAPRSFIQDSDFQSYSDLKSTPNGKTEHPSTPPEYDDAYLGQWMERNPETEPHGTQKLRIDQRIPVPLTPVTRKPRQTHPGCTTIKYNRKSNPDLEKRRIFFCDQPGQT